MTSAQMKAAFKMMQDFAPAIMKASEILESAEQAEVKLAEHQKKMDGLDATHADLGRQCEAAQVELRGVQTKLDQARHQTAVEREALEASLKDLKAQVQHAKTTLQATHDEHANTLAVYKQEIAQLVESLAQHKQALADFRKAIPKTY